MNAHNDPDLNQRLQDLEAEVGRSPFAEPFNPENGQPGQTMAWLNQFGQWFRALPGGGKAIVAGLMAICVLTLLSVVLQLISLAIKLAVAGVVLFGIYKLVVRPQSSP
jgi:hypothetical protein